MHHETLTESQDYSISIPHVQCTVDLSLHCHTVYTTVHYINNLDSQYCINNLDSQYCINNLDNIFGY